MVTVLSQILRKSLWPESGDPAKETYIRLAQQPACDETETSSAEDQGLRQQTCWQGEQAGYQNGETPTTWQFEARSIGRNATPLALSCLLEYSLSTATMVAVGRLGTIELGAASLASMTANFTAYTVYHGLATSLDTLGAQAYGSGKRHLVSVHFQRTVYFLLLVTVPILALWSVADRILPRIFPHRDTAVLAGRYLQVAAFGTPAYAIFESAKRYLQVQGIYSASLYSLIICAPFNAFLNWFLVWKCNMGFIGAPIALTITDQLLPCCLVLYVYIGSHDRCWAGFTRHALSDWGPMVRMALPALVTAEYESLASEMSTVVASHLGSTALAAQAVLSTVGFIAWQNSYALCMSVRVRIGTLIGAADDRAARTAATVSLYMSIALGLVILAFLCLMRTVIANTVATDQAVIDLVIWVLPLCGATQLAECVSLVGSGALCGIGRQDVTCYVQTMTFVITFTVMMATVFGLSWNVWGLWVGALAGAVAAACAEWWLIWRMRWRRCVEDGMRNIGV